MVRLLARHLVFAVITVVAAHALAVALVRVLPSPAEQLLGIFGVQQQALRALSEVNPPRSYPDMLLGMLQLDLGISADGVPVGSEVREGLGASLPRLVSALVVSILVAVTTALLVAPKERLLTLGLSYVVFFPPYGVPFVLLAGLLVSGWSLSPESAVMSIVGILAIAAGPAAMLSAQAGAVMKHHLVSTHVAFLDANGVDQWRLRYLLLANVYVELLPTLEKLIAGALVSLMFAEYVLGLPGIGTLAVRAVHRSDLELLAGVVLIYSAIICAARVLSAVAEHLNGVDR